jgi:hypothetical protein
MRPGHDQSPGNQGRTMTRKYSDMNQHDALYKVARAYPGGLEALALRMDISVNVLRNKLAPELTRTILRLKNCRSSSNTVITRE